MKNVEIIDFAPESFDKMNVISWNLIFKDYAWNEHVKKGL